VAVVYWLLLERDACDLERKRPDAELRETALPLFDRPLVITPKPPEVRTTRTLLPLAMAKV
jgi:hypothetical protein